MEAGSEIRSASQRMVEAERRDPRGDRTIAVLLTVVAVAALGAGAFLGAADRLDLGSSLPEILKGGLLQKAIGLGVVGVNSGFGAAYFGTKRSRMRRNAASAFGAAYERLPEAEKRKLAAVISEFAARPDAGGLSMDQVLQHDDFDRVYTGLPAEEEVVRAQYVAPPMVGPPVAAAAESASGEYGAGGRYELKVTQ